MARKKEEKNEYYNLLPIGIKKSKALTLNQKNVLATLIYLDWEHPEVIEKNDGWFFESLPKLEEMTNLTKPTILKSFAVLEKKGLIIRKVGSFKDKIATQYKVNHNLLHKYETKSVKNVEDNFTDKGNIDNIMNQLVNVIENTRKSVKNDDDNFTENSVKISVKNVEDNFTKDKDKLNNIYNQYITNICNQYMKDIIEKIEKTNKDLLLKLNQIENQITDLKNQFSSLKESNRLFEHRLKLLEDEIMPKEEEYYEYKSDFKSEDIPSYTDPSNDNLTYEERAKQMEELKKNWN